MSAGTVTNTGSGTLWCRHPLHQQGCDAAQRAGATLRVTANQNLADPVGGTGAALFRNEGRLVKEAGTGGGTTTISARFENGGSAVEEEGVEVVAGTLRLTGGGTSAGDFTVGTGATLELASGTYTLDGDLLGTGTLVSRSTVTFTKALDFPGIVTIPSGTTTLTPPRRSGRVAAERRDARPGR